MLPTHSDFSRKCDTSRIYEIHHPQTYGTRDPSDYQYNRVKAKRVESANWKGENNLPTSIFRTICQLG